MTVLIIIILGIIEGITEWLPVSSTGHLILFGNLLNPDLSDSFMEVFNILIQLGAIAAVVLVYFNKLWPFHTQAKMGRYSQFLNPDGSMAGLKGFADKYVYMDRIMLWLKIAASSIPALVVGLLFEDYLEEHMHKPIPIAVMLIVYGVLIIVVEIWNRSGNRKPVYRKISDITFKAALIIGCFQALAIVPGTSRSGATIIGGLIIGFSRPCIVQYTFYMAIPAMLGASAIKLLKTGFAFTSFEAGMLILGMVVAFVVSLFVIKWFVRLIKRITFTGFGYYRIALGAVVLIAAAAGLIK